MHYMTNEIIHEHSTCEFCGKPATQLCDMPKEPSIIMIGKTIHETCDRNICNECSTKFRVYDFCPACMHELRNVWNKKIHK